MKKSDLDMVQDLFGTTFTHMCESAAIAEAMESQLADVIQYAQEYFGASEHIKALSLMVVMPWEVSPYLITDRQLTVKLEVWLTPQQQYLSLSERDKKALHRAFEAIRKGL